MQGKAVLMHYEGLFCLHYDKLVPVLQITNRFITIIRIVCDILMFALKKVYEGFC